MCWQILSFMDAFTRHSAALTALCCVNDSDGWGSVRSRYSNTLWRSEGCTFIRHSPIIQLFLTGYAKYIVGRLLWASNSNGQLDQWKIILESNRPTKMQKGQASHPAPKDTLGDAHSMHALMQSFHFRLQWASQESMVQAEVSSQSEMKFLGVPAQYAVKCRRFSP